MLINFLAVGSGGFIGALLRHLFVSFVNKNTKTYIHLGTILVNIIGSFFMGFIIKFSNVSHKINEKLLLFLTVGIGASFTTFSTFTLNEITYLENQNYLYFFLYISITIGLSLFLLFLGLKLGDYTAKKLK